MTTQTTARPPIRAAQPPALPGAGLLTVLLGAALPIIDFFIVNVALPTIDADLHASAATLELVVAAYGIAYALLLVVGGRLGDALGRKRLFLIGLTAFTVTSLLCGIAPSALTLVSARAAQGAASALMLPQVLSTIQATTHGERRARAFGYYGATAGISVVLGQLLGGILVAADVAGMSWRPIFLVNVPIGLVGLLLARRTLPETRAAEPIGVDGTGTVLLGISLLCLLIPLMEGRALGWPAWCWGLLIVSPITAAVFFAAERRAELGGRVPLLPPSILRAASIRTGLAVAVPFFSGFGGFMFVYSMTLQDGLHLGPLWSGVALTPMAVAFLVMSLLASRLVARFGQRVVATGAGLQLAGILTLAGTVASAWPHLGVLELGSGMVVCGAGQGMVMPVLFRIVLSDVPSEEAGVGSGVLTTTQQTSLAFGVATLGSLFVGLSTSDSLGMEGAFVVVLILQAMLTATAAILARRLPDPRR